MEGGRVVTYRDLEFLSDDALQARLLCDVRELIFAKRCGIIRPCNTPIPGTCPSYLTDDIRSARYVIANARITGRPLGHDEPADAPKPGRRPADRDEPDTVPLEPEESPEMESDLLEMDKIFG